VSGFVRYGVYNDGGDVSVEGSTISDIGDEPFDGLQYGLGVYFVNPALVNPSLPSSPATGTISGNVISQYQKGGITVNGPGSSADISDNTVTGLGPVNFIAQNGVQIGFGATGSISHNKVSSNQYTGPGDTSSTGVLVFGGCQEPFGPEAQLSTGVSVANNTLTNNDIGVALANYDPSCTTSPTTKTQDNVVHNTITDDEVTNTTGYGAGAGGASICGYQAGVSDVGNHDGIKNNSISGVGYGPQTCTAATPAFLYPIDTSGATAPRVGHNVTA